MKRKRNFDSIDALKPVANIINEATEALKDSKRIILNSPIADVLAGALGVGIGGAGSFAALFYGGTVGAVVRDGLRAKPRIGNPDSRKRGNNGIRCPYLLPEPVKAAQKKQPGKKHLSSGLHQRVGAYYYEPPHDFLVFGTFRPILFRLRRIFHRIRDFRNDVRLHRLGHVVVPADVRRGSFQKQA